ncbi:hypothetical protein [Halococcus thailandensis]|nr:hypothetical protein [Halococcus thailandensis]
MNDDDVSASSGRKHNTVSPSQNNAEGRREDSEFLDQLMMSAPAINDALNHVLIGWKELRWSVIGQEDGIPVWYLCAYMDSSLGRYDLMRVIHRHVSHSPVAFRQDHDLEDSITIRNVGGESPLIESETLLPLRNLHQGLDNPSEAPIGSYVASHLLGFREDTDDCERLQRTINDATVVDTQFLPSPAFEETYKEAGADWNPEDDLPDGVEVISYGVGKYISGNECLSDGLNVEA